MAKIKAGEATWYCLHCQVLVPKRLGIQTIHGIFCSQPDCVTAIFESRYAKKFERVVETPKPCPRCGDPLKEKPMAKRMQTKLPSKPKSAEELAHDKNHGQDPSVEESLSSRIINGKAKPPKGTVFAVDMVPDELYISYEREAKVTQFVSKTEKLVRIRFYSGHWYGWLETDVPLMYPLSTDVTNVAREYKPKGDTKEAMMASKTRKHGTAAAKTAVVSTARNVNPKTGFKEGSVGDQVGIAYLSVTTPEKQLEKVSEVIRESFKAKGKSTAAEAVERQAKSWIGYIRKQNPKIYGEATRTVKPAKTEKPKVAKKAAATATA